MSMFLCAKCEKLRDSDNGCESFPGGSGLICSDCMDAEELFDDGLPLNAGEGEY